MPGRFPSRGPISWPSRTELSPVLPLFSIALCLAALSPSPRPHQGGEPIQASAASPDQPGQAVARGKDLLLFDAELEEVLLERFGLAPDGRELLRLLLNARMLDHLAREQGLVISAKDIDLAWGRLDREIKASGEAGGLAKEIEGQGLGREEFRQFLRLSILQERLTREALGIPAGKEVTGAQQEIWLDDQLTGRNLEILTPPWADGHVARCDSFAVTVEEFGRFLRQRLPRDEIEETSWHLLLLEGIHRRMPDIAPEALERAVDSELDRRRQRHAMDNPGLGFEELLGAQGRSLETLRRDPSVHIAALSHLWVDRTFGDEGLRATFEQERARFEGLFGKAARTHLMFLVASRHRNELNPRTFDEADQELARMLANVGNTDDFAALVRSFSEEPKTREAGGELGWVTRDDPRVPPVLRDALFRFVDGGASVPPEGTPLGPLRLDGGCAVLWVSGLRKSPDWERMAEHVHDDLRRRFIEETLVRSEVQLLSPQPAKER